MLMDIVTLQSASRFSIRVQAECNKLTACFFPLVDSYY